MAFNTYKLHRRALVALNELAPDEQAELMRSLTALLDVPPTRWSPAQARRFPGDQSLYLVPVNDSLRVIVRAADGQQPEIMDIVRHETLELFTKAAAKTGD
jgi:hypothetical protein